MGILDLRAKWNSDMDNAKQSRISHLECEDPARLAGRGQAVAFQALRLALVQVQLTLEHVRLALLPAQAADQRSVRIDQPRRKIGTHLVIPGIGPCHSALKLKVPQSASTHPHTGSHTSFCFLFPPLVLVGSMNSIP